MESGFFRTGPLPTSPNHCPPGPTLRPEALPPGEPFPSGSHSGSPPCMTAAPKMEGTYLQPPGRGCRNWSVSGSWAVSVWLQKLGVQALRLAGVQVCKTRPTYTYTKYTAFAQSPHLTPPYPRPHPLGPSNPALNHVWALKRPDTGYMPIHGLLVPPSF